MARGTDGAGACGGGAPTVQGGTVAGAACGARLKILFFGSKSGSATLEVFPLLIMMSVLTKMLFYRVP
jgi:hypothetical protein